MEDNERIVELMKSFDMTARQFAAEIGVQPSTISNIVSRRNRPSLELLQKISVAFPQLSTDWLFLGKGPMLSEKSDSQELISFTNDGASPLFSDGRGDNFENRNVAPNMRNSVSDSGSFYDEARRQTNRPTMPTQQQATKNSAESAQQSVSMPNIDMNVAMRDRKIKKVIILFDDNMYDVFDPSDN